MSDTPEPEEIFVEAPGPNELRDPFVRLELKRAAIWIGLVVGVMLIWFLSQPLLLIVGGVVFAAMLDGGSRLLGRVLPLPRIWRLTIIALLAATFMVWVTLEAGAQLIEQGKALRQIVEGQINVIARWAEVQGITGKSFSTSDITKEIAGSLGRLTSAISSALGAMTSIAMIIVIGIFLAFEPRNYERGLAWMLPIDRREQFYETSSLMAFDLRRLMAGRLLAMVVEGVVTWLLLRAGDVPMPALLGLLTGLFAFLPYIGAFISGALMVLVGFSAGTETGYWAITVYLIVHVIDGWIIVPYVARKSVDLAPALVLAAQLLFGALFGILGLALADPMVAMIKVALEKGSEESAERAARAKARRSG